MVRFLLKTLLVKSGEQEGALLLCVARVKKGGGEFLGGGELIGRIWYARMCERLHLSTHALKNASRLGPLKMMADADACDKLEN